MADRSSALLFSSSAANMAIAATGVNAPNPDCKEPRAIVTQRRIWHERGYDLIFQPKIARFEMAVLFWEDLSADQRQKVMACVHAGTMTALETIPL